MRIDIPKTVFAISAVTLPGIAYAQQISPGIAALALSPIVVLGLAITLGILARSWWVGVAHAALVGIWILLFGVASYWVENDLVIWTPLALYGTHATVMVVVIARGVYRRIRS